MLNIQMLFRDGDHMVGIVKLRLSSKRRIPIFYVKGSIILDREWYPYQLADMAKTILEKRNWQVASDGLRLEQKKLGLILLPQHASLFVHEWSIWKRWYCPVSVRGKDVLDVGAGCGETAYFYFRKGARKVICVEPDRSAVECLVENVTRHSWNVELLPEPFRLEMLREHRFDFMKMDGEGCEEQLMRINKLPTEAIVESHSPQLTEALTKRFTGSRVVAELSQTVSLLHIPSQAALTSRTALKTLTH